MRIGMVASVGGLKPVAVVGVAQAFAEAGIWHEVQGFAAASGGAPWCALLATGLSPPDVAEIARSVRRSDYWRPNPAALLRVAWLSLLRRQIGATIGEVGYDNGKAMERWLHNNLVLTTFEDLARPLAIPVCALNLRRMVTLTSGPLIPAIRATTAIPVAYKPATIIIDGQECKCVDGGVGRPVPIQDLLDLVPDLDLIVTITACNRGDDSPYIRSRKIDLGEYLDMLIDTLVLDHLKHMYHYAAKEVGIVVLPVRYGASMSDPERTIPRALEEAQEQARQFLTSHLWQQIAIDPSAFKGTVTVFE